MQVHASGRMNRHLLFFSIIATLYYIAVGVVLVVVIGLVLGLVLIYIHRNRPKLWNTGVQHIRSLIDGLRRSSPHSNTSSVNTTTISMYPEEETNSPSKSVYPRMSPQVANLRNEALPTSGEVGNMPATTTGFQRYVQDYHQVSWKSQVPIYSLCNCLLIPS